VKYKEERDRERERRERHTEEDISDVWKISDRDLNLLFLEIAKSDCEKRRY
jgi:hypothetical protein